MPGLEGRERPQLGEGRGQDGDLVVADAEGLQLDQGPDFLGQTPQTVVG